MKNKKWFWAVLIIFSTVKLCYAQKENSRNIELVKTWIKNLTNHDTVALANMYADRAIIESPNWKGSKKGPSSWIF